MNSISDLIKTIETLSIEDFKSQSEEFKKLARTIETKQSQLERWQKEQDSNRLRELIKATNFQEPKYGSYDYDDEDEELTKNGEVTFESQEQATELLKLLNNQSWQYLYVMKEWQGAGTYDIIPSSEYRCGDTEYTGTLVKRV